MSSLMILQFLNVVVLISPGLLCYSSENFTITRAHLDLFIVPPSFCGSYVNKTVMCQEYNAFLTKKKNNCTCKCVRRAPTFGFFNNTWNCTKNNIVRSVLGITDLTLKSEKRQDSVIKVFKKDVSVDSIYETCDHPTVAVNGTSLLRCDGFYQDLSNKDFKFAQENSTEPCKFAYTPSAKGENMKGHIIRIKYHKGNVTQWFGVKIQGSVTSPPTITTHSLPVATSLPKQQTSPKVTSPQQTSTSPQETSTSSSKQTSTQQTSSSQQTSTSPPQTTTSPSQQTSTSPPQTTTSPSQQTTSPPPSSPSIGQPWIPVTSTPTHADQRETDQQEGSKPDTLTVTSGVVSVILVLLILAIIVAAWYRRRRLKNGDTTGVRSEQSRVTGMTNDTIPRDDNDYAFPLPTIEKSQREPVEGVYSEPYSDNRNAQIRQNLQSRKTQPGQKNGVYEQAYNEEDHNVQPADFPGYVVLEGPDSEAFPDEQPTDAPVYGVLESPVYEGTYGRQPIDGPVYGVLEGPEYEGTYGGQPTDDPVYDVLEGPEYEGTYGGQPIDGPVYGVLEGPEYEGTYGGQPTDGPVYGVLEGPEYEGTYGGQPTDGPVYGVLEGPEYEGTYGGQPTDGPVYGVLEGPEYKGTYRGQPTDGPVYGVLEGPEYEGTYGGQPTDDPVYDVLEGPEYKGTYRGQPTDGPVYGVLEEPDSVSLDMIEQRSPEVMDSPGATATYESLVNPANPVYGSLIENASNC
ncbi:uncharacterized protein LOC5516335 isoform X2 [Nematostella vectensis]|uniref:uncharacterized protein LOC5516335 isoform X2 n=1 Tax=Nematostella vectensis TaxID=45351 RepID=UPI00207706A4|nr:uncharacterized protein LOC5516335 isoform X2 [Nematostella vectensis]